MEPEGSLPCSQEPTVGTYTEQDESGPHLPNLFSHLHVGLLNGLFPSGYLIKTHFSSLLCMLHALPISSLIWSHQRFFKFLRFLDSFESLMSVLSFSLVA